MDQSEMKYWMDELLAMDPGATVGQLQKIIQSCNSRAALYWHRGKNVEKVVRVRLQDESEILNQLKNTE